MANIIDGKALAQKVKELPEKYRVVVILHYYDSLPIKEIVKILSPAKQNLALSSPN